MRKLKLQIQMTLDGFVAGPQGELDWMWGGGEPDPASFQKVIDLAASSDTMLLGRKMTRQFIDYWENVADNQPESPEHAFSHQMVDMRKIAFSHTETTIPGRNLQVENGDLATAVQALKNESGKDIIVYGGASFASSLISLNLIDEYYIFRSPVAIGKGLSIFPEKKQLKLVNTILYENWKVLEHYIPA